jgi:hypothetical protein
MVETTHDLLDKLFELTGNRKDMGAEKNGKTQEAACRISKAWQFYLPIVGNEYVLNLFH